MKNLFVGVCVGIVVSYGVHFVWSSEPGREQSKPYPTPSIAGTTQVVPESYNNHAALDEQTLRRIIQEELKTALASQMSTPDKGMKNANQKSAQLADDFNGDMTDNHQTPDTPNNSATFQTVSAIVESAKSDGYFSSTTLSALKTQYAKLSDEQKFKIDAKIADSMNNGYLEFDESLFLNLPQ